MDIVSFFFCYILYLVFPFVFNHYTPMLTFTNHSQIIFTRVLQKMVFAGGFHRPNTAVHEKHAVGNQLNIRKSTGSHHV